MEALATVQTYLVSSHLAVPAGPVTMAALSIVGVAAYKGSKAKDTFFLALVVSFFRYAYAVPLVLNILLNGHKGPSALFNSADLKGNAFVIHTVVYVLMSFSPNDIANTVLKHKFVLPLIEGAVLINVGACATKAMDATATAGVPYSLIAGFLVWNGAYWLRSTKVTLEGMIQSALVLVPYYFVDSLKGPLGATKPQFVLGLACMQLVAQLAEAHAQFSLVAKVTDLYGKAAGLIGSGLKGLKKGAAKRMPSPPKSPRGKKSR